MDEVTPPDDDIFSEAYVAAQKAQAGALKEHAAKAGLAFGGYFVPRVAQWALAEIEAGRFTSPSEIVFVAMQTFVELSKYPDLRRELLRREVQESIDDPGESLSSEETFAQLQAHIQEIRDLKPARWNSEAAQDAQTEEPQQKPLTGQDTLDALSGSPHTDIPFERLSVKSPVRDVKL